MLDTNLKTVFHRNSSLTRFEGGYAESAEYILVCRIYSRQAAYFLSLPILFYLQVASSINVTKCYPKSLPNKPVYGARTKYTISTQSTLPPYTDKGLMIRRKKRKYTCFLMNLEETHSQANTTHAAPHAYFLVSFYREKLDHVNRLKPNSIPLSVYIFPILLVDVQKISFFIKFWGSLKNIFLNVRVGSGFLHVILKLIHQEIIMCKSNSQRSCVEFPPNRTIVVHYIMTWWEDQKIRVFHFLMSDIGGGGHGKRW